MGFPFSVEIGNERYELVEKKEEENGRKNYIDIYKFVDNEILKLDNPWYYRIRRRIYHTIKNIDNLADGKVRNYEIWNQLD